MVPLAEYLVGYLSMFLQLGVLTLLAVLTVLVRVSLGRRPLDGWSVGLAANAAALAVLGVAAVGRDAGVWPTLPGATIAYAILEYVAALAFIAAVRRERRLRPVPAAVVAAAVLAVALVAVAAFGNSSFFGVYRIHSACLSLLLALGAIQSARARFGGIGARLLTISLGALAVDYGHVPLLTLLGVRFPDTYVAFESYGTMVLDIALGVAIVVHATDRARTELERRNVALAQAECALRDAAYTDALCGVPNRAAFLDRIAAPPPSGVVAMVDLDGLKTINDRYGHAAGDAALEMTARCLRRRCGSTGAVYRIGGDEFAGIWSGADPDTVRAMLAACERDLDVLAEDVQAPVRISWGVAAFGADTPFDDALIAADAQLYDRRSVRRV